MSDCREGKIVITVAWRGLPDRRAISPKKSPAVSLRTRDSAHSALEGLVGWFSTSHCAQNKATSSARPPSTPSL